MSTKGGYGAGMTSDGATKTFTIEPAGPFSLEEAATFGFGQRHETGFDGTMRLAFCVDGYTGQAGVALSQDEAGVVHGTITGTAGRPDLQAIAAQTARVLSLDHDAAGYVDVGRRDAVVARLQAAAPGLRPPLFHSPYEAAFWAVLSVRRPRRTAEAWRTRIAQARGARFDVAGSEMWALPTPDRLLDLEEVPGVDATRVERIRGVAAAALDGRLDPAALRAVDVDAARARLRSIPGIGPFYADLILLRATGVTDVLPAQEPRLLGLIGELYGLGRPATPAEAARLGETWAPWRTWTAVLVRAAGPRVLGRPRGPFDPLEPEPVSV
jgi:DNA-3-methyladenine glycosylase II